MMDKIIEIVKKYNDISFYITIPIWDNYGRNIINEKSLEEYENISYKPIEIVRENMKLVKKLILIPKNKYKYYDHFKKIFINIVSTYIIYITQMDLTNKQIEYFNKLENK